MTALRWSVCAIIVSMFDARLKSLQKTLNSNKAGPASGEVDGLIVSSAINIQYLTSYSNFSKAEREAYLFVTETNAALFTDGRYIEAVRKIVPKGIKVFFHTELFKKIKVSKAKKIGVEHNFTLAELKRFKKETGKKFVLIDNLIENMRAIKNESEIKNIRKACRLTDKTFGMIHPLIKFGVTEKEIAWKIEEFIKDAGGELAFEPIVAFGPNAAIPHHETSNKKLSKSDHFLLLDFGAKVNNYCSDMTRTLLTGSASKKAKKIYETVLRAQKAVYQSINRLILSQKSIYASQTTEAANKIIAESGFPQIPHGLGHGIGLEVHEEPRLSPKSKNKLVQGNTFTIEPGIYIPGFGGVRIEDDFLLKNRGIEQLTKSPKEILLIY